jgi:hypothetical protein
MLAVACALLEHADAAVVQAESYEGAGPGEIPSLPRLIPKILHSTLQHCVEEGQQGGGGAVDCQAQQPAPLLQLFLRARGLLQDFLRLMEHMKIRTVLEDEREIVLELCVDLVSFHKLLIDSDLKSLLKVF